MTVEEKYAQTIAIVYPAVAPSEVYNLPTDPNIRTHVTLNTLGEMTEIGFTKDQVISALQAIEWSPIDDIEVKGLELFGPENDFLVLEIDSPSLQRNWKLVTESLNSSGIQTLDKYPSYRPHITLMEAYKAELPIPAFLPSVIKVGFPQLWWGNETILLK